MDSQELIQRTGKFAVRIIKFVQYLEENYKNIGRRLGDQILRSGTGMYSNYRAACRCKSAKDFIHKMGTVVEESDETVGWLELFIASGIAKELAADLLKEANELTAIMAASRSTAIKNHPK